jgi:hypothetical protein
MRENVWIAERKEAYAKRKQEIPPPQDLARSFAEARAARLATLGVTAALGEVAAQSGDDDKAMDYLASARLSGLPPAPPTRSSKLSTKRATTELWTVWKRCGTRNITSASPIRSAWRRISPRKNAAFATNSTGRNSNVTASRAALERGAGCRYCNFPRASTDHTSSTVSPRRP